LDPRPLGSQGLSASVEVFDLGVHRRTKSLHRPGAQGRFAISKELQSKLVQAIQELPEDQREVFMLREYGSLAFKEIADIVGAPENTVKSRMRYALERLQSALAEYEEYAKALG
jgi:RNA polymerase sigma-70 factor (ECF subfamily)